MERKEMVLKIGEFFGVDTRYLGPPSFAYEIIAPEETYTVDRHGTITTSAGREITLEEILNASQPEEEMGAGRETETLEDENLNQEESENLGTSGFELEFHFEDHTGVTLQNIVNMLTSKQHLIMKAFELADEMLDQTFAEELSAKEISTIEDFKTAFMKLGPPRCRGLAFDFDRGIITFKLPAKNLDTDKVAAFKDLAVLINLNAKKLKRASFKPTQDDNPKFAFRTWLTRLGMNGKEYKATRKVLLSNLAGSGAFRKVGSNNE